MGMNLHFFPKKNNQPIVQHLILSTLDINGQLPPVKLTVLSASYSPSFFWLGKERTGGVCSSGTPLRCGSKTCFSRQPLQPFTQDIAGEKFNLNRVNSVRKCF